MESFSSDAAWMQGLSQANSVMNERGSAGCATVYLS
jgi:hypothetical protein